MEKTVIAIPEPVRALLETLTAAGYQAYAVGGCVRDSLRGTEPHDWDICTDALPEQMRECFRAYHVIETGLRHGTLTVMRSGVPYEVTTFRVDGTYSDHRHPDRVEFVDTLREDLQRRDFTINAMAAGADGAVIDCFGGREDLSRGLLRCVGDAEERFQEDALRILRALRFAARFSLEMEAQTEKALREKKGLLAEIAAERVQKELSGLLLGDCAEMLLRFPEVLAVRIPEILPCVGFQQHNPHHDRDVWGHTAAAVSAAPKDLYVRLALLYHDLGKPRCFTVKDGIGHFYGHAAVSAEIAEASLNALRFDRRTVRIVTELVAAHDRTIEPKTNVLRRCLNRFGAEQLFRLLEVQSADRAAHVELGEVQASKAELTEKIEALLAAQRRQEECLSLKDLAVDGNDLIHIGFPRGKKIGDCLNELLRAVMEGELKNDRETLLAAARRFSEL